MPVTVTVRGAKELAAALDQAPRAVSAAAQAAMTKSLLLVEAEARRTVAHDTRALMNSITSQQAVRGDTLVGKVGPSLQYGLYVETGTRPHWPPAAPLVGWARRHGIPVRMVQLAIARRGTRARPFLQPAFEKYREQIVALFAQANVTVTETLARGARRGGPA
jgi:HK97 gp10 family phage protein